MMDRTMSFEAFIDLLPITILALTLWRVRWVLKPSSASLSAGMSTDRTRPLRGVMALMVITHHIAQRTAAGILIRPYTDMGYLPVAAFFFLSGYGLLTRWRADPDYRRDFLKRRFTALIGSLLPVMGIYTALHLLCGPSESLPAACMAIINEANAWFLVELAVFYLAFALLMRLCERPWIVIGMTAVCCAVYTAACVALSLGDWWYKSSPAFVLGMVWALCGEGKRRVPARFDWILTVLCWAFCVLIHCNIWTVGWFMPMKAYIPSALSACLFVLGTALMTGKVHIDNPALRCLGGISYEIYIVQGLFLSMLRGRIVYITSDFVYSVLVITGTLLVSAGLHRLVGLALERISVKNTLR